MVSDYLTKRERLDAIRFGARSYAGYLDALDSIDASDGISKQAQDSGVISGLMEALKNGVMLTAIMGGIPIGIGMHHIGRRIDGRRMAEEELKEKIKVYQNAADEMAEGLAD